MVNDDRTNALDMGDSIRTTWKLSCDALSISGSKMDIWDSKWNICFYFNHDILPDIWRALRINSKLAALCDHCIGFSMV